MSTEPTESQPVPATQDAFAGVPQQQEMPLAIVRGEPILQMPQDLYIPPDALEVILEAFEGPLDLLLYLIRRQNLDILDIPIAEITRQYMEYIDMMRDVMRLELAAEYLLMAAILAEIKSRLLLPRPPTEEGLEEDPRAELVRRLQEYERFKKAAEDIDALPRMERDTVAVQADVGERNVIKLPPPLDLKEMLLALKDVLHRAELFGHHAIKREALSVRQRMGELLSRLDGDQFHRFESLFDITEGRLGVVVTFLAMLELAKEFLINIVQEEPLGPIYVKANAGSAEEEAEVAADDDAFDEEQHAASGTE
jgi:segregation and condensation protein A